MRLPLFRAGQDAFGILQAQCNQSPQVRFEHGNADDDIALQCGAGNFHPVHNVGFFNGYLFPFVAIKVAQFDTEPLSDFSRAGDAEGFLRAGAAAEVIAGAGALADDH